MLEDLHAQHGAGAAVGQGIELVHVAGEVASFRHHGRIGAESTREILLFVEEVAREVLGFVRPDDAVLIER